MACHYIIRSHFGAQLLLSDERCDVNLQNSDGDTALMTTVRNVACISQDYKLAKILRLLLAHPLIDVNKQNKQGDTALHEASSYFVKSQVVALLLLTDGRCDVNARNNDDNTPPMLAAQNDDDFAMITQLLLKNLHFMLTT